MKISGFTMGKNVTKLYYPIKESILSILPICDEFIVALGNCDEDDKTREEILSINSPKIKIIDTVWDIEKYPNGTEMAHQTDIAKSYCTGDWLFSIQTDEVIHENDLPKIKRRCEELLHDEEIEGILFKFIHFYGDYQHHNDSHGWHKHEIRIIRNNKDIHSWCDSMSFRRIPNFDGISYRSKNGAYKLKVALVDATIYHYSWVRPPEFMQKKNNAFTKVIKGSSFVPQQNIQYFDYGPLNKLPIFKGSHPQVMNECIARFNWKDKLQYSGKLKKGRGKQKHEKLKYRFITFLEKYVFCRPMWEFKNYILLKR
ncbi:MAG TPA: hypothetical protein VIO15_11260 [Bacteroidales bacterium]